ncbi:putative toxin-antitoxin system toxin component, PIN family [Adhaeribacter arboris]|uniref:Putative toxin-antitoxin system toxin component, PIN family n=1 Tax=Adhaeribacter arboris TaxID=2072846 RepID=A0A2T2YH13_9BACT|nr:putative toxin-antitoxin system toxin component, PIN family [Adhaeribacter arboris]PSR54816.1 putative toxin-antitoxin system toxin component, PIN family [Adhaeribacter arboris]
MVNKPKRIIIDTNLWISFLITKSFNNIDNLIATEKVQLLFSQELVDEFLQVTQRPKFKKFFKQKDVQLLIEVLGIHAELITITSSVEECRDSKDNFLLSLAVDGKADYLLTGDKDLLELKSMKATKI